MSRLPMHWKCMTLADVTFTHALEVHDTFGSAWRVWGVWHVGCMAL